MFLLTKVTHRHNYISHESIFFPKIVSENQRQCIYTSISEQIKMLMVDRLIFIDAIYIYIVLLQYSIKLLACHLLFWWFLLSINGGQKPINGIDSKTDERNRFKNRWFSTFVG